MPGRRGMGDLLAEQDKELAAIDTGHRETAQPAAPPAPDAAAIPEPYETGADGPLGADEQASLSVCEAALDNLRMAFWAAGKALQVIRDARLYRDGYDTFEAYCASPRWEMSRAQAYRLIATWRLAERLSPIGDKLNTPQVLELLPVVKDHGEDAAEVVYGAVVRTDGVTVTAARLRDVVAILPGGPFDSAAAVEQIRAYLAGELTPPPPGPVPPPGPGRVFAAKASRLAKVLEGDATPDEVSECVADVEAYLGEIKRERGIKT